MKWKPKDIVIVIITVTICFVLMMVFVSALFTGKELTDEGRKIVSDIIIALIAIISFWIGQKAVNKK